jgi:hypothetical protein
VANVEKLPPVEAAAARERCELVVDLPAGNQVSLEAEIVFVESNGPGRGVGLTLLASDLEVVLRPLEDALVEVEACAASSFELVAPQGEELPGIPTSARGQEGGRGQNIHERVRKLSAAERDRMARSGGMTERVALERAYGAAVWEGLLQNPQLTGGEVARIAKNGTASTPLLGLIAANASWVARGEVRRALLGNPRLGAPFVEKVLRATPKAEIKLVAKQALYPQNVRVVAARILKQMN